MVVESIAQKKSNYKEHPSITLAGAFYFLSLRHSEAKDFTLLLDTKVV